MKYHPEIGQLVNMTDSVFGGNDLTIIPLRLETLLTFNHYTSYDNEFTSIPS